MKETSELNSKAWYRLLKVLFIISFILIAIGSIIIIYDVNKPTEREDFRVVCNYGNKSIFLAWQDKSIFLSSFDLRNGVGSILDYQKENIQQACDITEKELKDKFNAVLNKIDDGKRLFDISETKVIVGNTLKAVLFSVLGFIITVIVFEILRRIFYYIVLGKIRPKK